MEKVQQWLTQTYRMRTTLHFLRLASQYNCRSYRETISTDIGKLLPLTDDAEAILAAIAAIGSVAFLARVPLAKIGRKDFVALRENSVILHKVAHYADSTSVNLKNSLVTLAYFCIFQPRLVHQLRVVLYTNPLFLVHLADSIRVPHKTLSLYAQQRASAKMVIEKFALVM